MVISILLHMFWVTNPPSPRHISPPSTLCHSSKSTFSLCVRLKLNLLLKNMYIILLFRFYFWFLLLLFLVLIIRMRLLGNFRFISTCMCFLKGKNRAQVTISDTTHLEREREKIDRIGNATYCFTANHWIQMSSELA